ESRVLGRAHPSHWAHEPHASDQVSVHRIDRGSANANKNFIVVRRRLFQVADLKIADAIFAIHDSFHGIGRGSSFLIAIVGRHPVGDKRHEYQRDKDREDTPLQNALYLHRPNEACLLSCSTVITTFPRAWPSSKYRIASAVSLNL